MFSDPVTMFQEGGPFILPILGVVSVLMLTSVLLFGTLVGRLRVPVLIWYGLGSLPLFIGFVGTYQGAALTLGALRGAAPDVAWKLASVGLGLSLYSTVFGAMGAALLFVTFAFATGLATAVRPGRKGRLTIANAIIAVLFTLLGAILAPLFAGFGASLVVFAAGTSLVLVSLRFADEDEDDPVGSERDRRRAAASRLAVAGYGLAALFCNAVASLAYTGSAYYRIQGEATLDMRRALMSATVDGVVSLQLGILGVALFLAFVAPFIVGPGMRAIDRRSVLTTLFVPLFLLPTAAMSGLMGWNLYQLAQEARPASAVRAASLARKNLVMPKEGKDLGLTALTSLTTLTFSSKGVLLNDAPGEPADLPALLDRADERRVAIEAPSDTPLALVASWFETVRPGLCVVVDANGVLGCLDLRLGPELPAEPPPPPDPEAPPIELAPASETHRLQVKQTSMGWSWRFEAPTSEPMGELDVGLSTVAEGLSAVRGQHGQTSAYVWFGQEATVDDLIRFVEKVSVVDEEAGGKIRLPEVVWSLDEAPGFPDEVDIADLDPVADFEQIARRVVQKERNAMRVCYERELSKKPDLAGQLAVQVEIGPDGSVIRARLLNSTLANNTAEQCIVTRFRSMSFPSRPTGGVEVLRFPYTFAPD